MPKITLTNVVKRWGNFYGVENLDLDIEDNSFVTLLGPSGCGKTTTLRMIAGLETPTSGQIVIGDEVVFDSDKGINIPANKRHVGFLFQNYALWPNMTVYQNISFGLTNIKKEMPLYDYDVKNIDKLVSILETPYRVIELANECIDKKGKINKERLLLKFIDAFEVSMFTAKTLYAYGIHLGDNAEAKANEAIAELKEKKEALLSSHKEKGESLNENYEIVKDGDVVKKVRKLNKEEIDLKVRAVSRIVKVGIFMDRYPAELSGGQQQRVAIARTLAPEPSVLFMDEPLSNLDAKLRLEMRYELQRLHVETGSTFVYVTHDQMEAMTLATKICLINNGVLQMYEKPLTVYNKPNNLFVADFVGNPSINFIEAKGKEKAKGNLELELLDGKKATFKFSDNISLEEFFTLRDKEALAKEELRQARLKDKKYVEKSNKDEVFKYHIQKVEEDDEVLKKDYTPVNGDLVLGVRPEFISIKEGGALKGEVYGAMPTGMESTIKVRVGEFLLTSVIFGSNTFEIGSMVNLDIIGENVMVFDRVSGKLIGCGSLKIA